MLNSGLLGMLGVVRCIEAPWLNGLGSDIRQKMHNRRLYISFALETLDADDSFIFKSAMKAQGA